MNSCSRRGISDRTSWHPISSLNIQGLILLLKNSNTLLQFSFVPSNVHHQINTVCYPHLQVKTGSIQLQPLLPRERRRFHARSEKNYLWNYPKIALLGDQKTVTSYTALQLWSPLLKFNSLMWIRSNALQNAWGWKMPISLNEAGRRAWTLANRAYLDRRKRQKKL